MAQSTVAVPDTRADTAELPGVFGAYRRVRVKENAIETGIREAT